MRYTVEHTRETRARILEAARRLFRRDGYGGSGIDGLTKAAGVTNGAFYGHFASKREAFRAALVAGVAELRQGIADLKAARGPGWLKTFVGFYLGPRRTCGLEESCVLTSLSAEVARADADTRAAYEAELRGVLDEVAAGLDAAAASARRDQAIALLAALVGGVTLARAVPDAALGERIAQAVRRHVLAFATAA